MKQLLFCLSILIPSFTHAQMDYSVDAMIGLDYTHVKRSFFTSNIDSKFNYRLGVNFNVKILDNVHIKTGLRYAEVGYKEDIQDLRWPSEIGPNGYEPDPSLPKYYINSIDQMYIELPMMLRYEMSDKKLAFYFEAGILPHIYLSSRFESTSNLGTTVTNIDDIPNRFILAYGLSAGLNYSISNIHQLFIQPTFRVYPSSASPASVRDARTSIGVEMGMRRGFQFQKRKVPVS